MYLSKAERLDVKHAHYIQIISEHMKFNISEIGNEHMKCLELAIVQCTHYIIYSIILYTINICKL